MAILVKRWHVIFCKKSYWIVKDVSSSKDIAQECWQIIMDKLHTLQKPSSFKSWALRIVYSKSLDALREINRKRLNESDYKMTKILVVEESQENTELKAALLKAVKALPEQQQAVLRLFYTEDYSLKDISKLLNISVGTTKSRLFHAREKLKTLLKEQYINR
ncbi:MAG: RNA polymerase sigma factor [Algicola sp.]|nr:RNA polymerase sigma factor [Algicola sp.]